MKTEKKDIEKKVAIIIPLSNRSELTDDELISLKHLKHFLGDHDKYFVMPESLQFDKHDGFGEKRFDNGFFGSAANYNRLMLTPVLYEAFIEYEYILIYHLDCLVFSDQLIDWCNKGYDYIGAPWIKHNDAPYSGHSDWEGYVGNGGFCLRKVKSCLNVLNSKELFQTPEEYWKGYDNKSMIIKLLNYPKKYLKRFSFFKNDVKRELIKYRINEEHFWVHRAQHYSPGFNFAPLDDALKFAFECVPRYCFEQNNNQLPFGCHAWERYDKTFWENYIIK